MVGIGDDIIHTIIRVTNLLLSIGGIMLLTDEELSIIEAEVDSHYENPMADRYKAVAKAQLKKVVDDIDYMSEACDEKGAECAYSTALYLRVPMDYWKELRQALLDEVKDAV